jgi:cellulose synthase (UDP-forming)
MKQSGPSIIRNTPVTKKPVLRRSDRIQFFVLTVGTLLATAAFLIAWFRLEAWRDHPVMVAVLSLILLVMLGNRYGQWLLLPKMRNPKAIDPRPGLTVGVVTSIVPDLEPLVMLENTLNALVALDYPHETWVLDEGDDERVKELCMRRGVFHFSRKYRPQYQTETGLFRKATKYGNYNAWLYEIGFERYEFIAAFDPDHVPEQTFLSKVLGYFEDPKIGYVQVPQMYSNQDQNFIARGAAEESYAFYSSVQMASYGLGYPIIVGCHNTHRISALREMGGFAPHDADDLLLTILYRTGGWEGVYVPEILARGLAPAEWRTYLNQQRRWARSLLDIKLKIAPSLTPKLPFFPRIMNRLHGLHYLHQGILFPILFLLLMVMLVTGEIPHVLNAETILTGTVLIIMLQLCERYQQQFYLDRNREQGLHWCAVLLNFAKWPYLIMALCDVLLDRKFPYMITTKMKEAPRPSFSLWPHVPAIIMLGIAWAIGLFMHETVPVEVQVIAGTVILFTLALLTTEWVGVARSASNS